MAGNRVHVEVTGDKTGLSKSLKGAGQDVDRFGKKTESSLKKTAKSISTGLVVAAAVGVKLAKDAIARAEEMNSAYAITEQIIKQTGSAAKLTGEQIKELAKAQAMLTGIDKAAVTEGMNIILTFKNVRDEVGAGNDIFTRATKSMLDMSTVMGTDAKSGAVQLGKALNDPILGVSALNRVGVQFTDTQKKQIRLFVESGDVMSAQKIILGELESQMGGTAKAAADDSAKIARAFDEISEAVGMRMLPYLAAAAIEVQKLLGVISDLQSQALQSGLDVGSVELAAGAINKLGKEAKAFWALGPSAGKKFKSGIEEILDESNLGIPALHRLSRGVEILRDEFDLTGGQAEVVSDIIQRRLIEALEGSRSVIANLRPPLTAVTEETGALGDAAELTAEEIKALASAEDRQTAATDRAREALEKKREVLQGIHEPLFRVVSLTDDLKDAEKEVEKAAKKGITSPEYRAAVIARAGLIADLNDTMRKLREDGIDPTGEAAARMLEGLGIPAGVMADIFAAFDAMEANFERREFRLGMVIPGYAPESVWQGGRQVRHTGGRINAPTGQEVPVTLLGGEEVSNPAHAAGRSGASVVIYNEFTINEATAGYEVVRHIREELERIGQETA